MYLLHRRHTVWVLQSFFLGHIWHLFLLLAQSGAAARAVEAAGIWVEHLRGQELSLRWRLFFNPNPATGRKTYQRGEGVIFKVAGRHLRSTWTHTYRLTYQSLFSHYTFSNLCFYFIIFIINVLLSQMFYKCCISEFCQPLHCQELYSLQLS